MSPLMTQILEIDTCLSDALLNANSPAEGLELKLRGFMKMGDLASAALDSIPADDAERQRIERFLHVIVGLVDSTVEEILAEDQRCVLAAMVRVEGSTLH